MHVTYLARDHTALSTWPPCMRCGKHQRNFIILEINDKISQPGSKRKPRRRCFAYEPFPECFLYLRVELDYRPKSSMALAYGDCFWIVPIDFLSAAICKSVAAYCHLFTQCSCGLDPCSHSLSHLHSALHRAH